MKKPIKILLFFIVVLGIISCQIFSPNQPALTGKDLYLKLRNDALQIKPETLGIKVDSNSNVPYGVLMDNVIDSNGSICTTISFASGDASLICDSGNGRSDGIKYQTVQTASKKFVAVAVSLVDKMELTSEYSLPTVFGDIKFYIVTPHGIYTTTEMTDSAAMSGSLARLYMAGENVINAFRLSDQQP